MSDRVHRSIMNIKVGIIFYILSILLAFFSRKIFLDCLGAEFIGLTGMLMNIMSFLSVAELGIGTSIVFFLYKPLQEDDHEKINEIMSILAYLYRCIGLVIGLGGLFVSIFFPWWFGHLNIGISLIYYAFYSFLASSIAGYIFNYKQLLVGANQKQYLVNAYFQTIGIVQSIVQIVLAYYYRNLWLWVSVGLLFTAVGIIVFNLRIRQLYPWLKINLSIGRQNLKKYPDVLTKTKQLFVHRIKGFILYRCDEIFVGAFVSVTHVAFYGNYTIIISKLGFLINILSDSMNAGIGNLLSEGNMHNIMKVFWELTAIRFFIVGIVVYGLLLFTQPFIACWFGEEYLLDNIILYLLVFNIFIHFSRGVVEMFIDASGLFSDTWTAWIEFIINITITLCLAPFYGIIGILLGKIVSVFFIASFWKPYFLFKHRFHTKVSAYWRGSIIYYSIFGGYLCITLFLSKYWVAPNTHTILNIIKYAIITYLPLIICYFISLFIITNGMKYFVARKPNIYKLLSIIQH